MQSRKILMSRDYSENLLVEQAAIELFQSLGYAYLDCFQKHIHRTLSREVYYSISTPYTTRIMGLERVSMTQQLEKM
jgi:hypothetical protein